MSFAEDLWHNLELVQKHSQERRKGGEEFVQLLRERAMHEDFYAQGLQKIGSHPYTVTSQGTLARAVAAMKEECAARAVIAHRLSNSIISDLVDPLRELLKDQTLANKKQVSEVKQTQREMKSLKDVVISTHERYVQQFQKTEQLVVTVEDAKSLSEKKRILATQGDELNEKMDKVTRSYREAVATYNQFIPKYEDVIATALQGYQMQEEQRLQAFGDALKRLHTMDNLAVNQVQTELFGKDEVDSYLGVRQLQCPDRCATFHIGKQVQCAETTGK